VYDTQVTEAGLEAFEQARPGVQVLSDHSLRATLSRGSERSRRKVSEEASRSP